MNQFFCDIATGILSNRKKNYFFLDWKQNLTAFSFLVLYGRRKNTTIETLREVLNHSSRFSDDSFSSYLVPQFQNEARCTTFHVKITLICKTTNLQENFISSWKVCTKARFDTEVRATWKWLLCRARRLYYTRYKPSAPKTRTKWLILTKESEVSFES